MAPNRSLINFNSATVPTTNTRIWTNGGITHAFWLDTINRSALGAPGDGLANPTTAHLPSTAVTAIEIVNVCRAFAHNTTRIRRVQFGLYFTRYSHPTGTWTGVPSDNPQAHIWGRIDGELNGGVGVAHLTSAYLYAIPNVSDTPAAGSDISAARLNAFYANLRSVSNANTSGAPIVDLRICHSSCHNNCHSSRGRR